MKAARNLQRVVAMRWLFALVPLGSSCYQPETRDCTVACSETSDCADGQGCTRDRFCAAPTIATCAPSAVSDGGTLPAADGRTLPSPPSDASRPPPPLPDARATTPPPPDATVRPDAGPPNAQLTVIISGNGSVRTNVGLECTDSSCTYSIPINTAVTLTAVNHGKNVFQEWQGVPCMGQGQTCQFTSSASAVTASVLFSHEH